MAIQIRRGTNTEWESNNSNIVVGEPAIATDAERFFVGTASGDYAEFANLDIIAPAYDTSTSYVVGDVINRQGKLYSCNTPCSGSFNPSYWDEKSLAEILKDLENEIDYAQYEIGYASGELITIDNGASEIPVKDLTLDIEAVQSGSGDPSPTNVRPISGWTGCEVNVTGVNVWDEEWESGTYDAYGAKGNNANYIRSSNNIKVMPNTEYCIAKTEGKAMLVCEYDFNGTFIKRVFTTSSQETAGYFTYTTTAETHYITFAIGGSSTPATTYNNDVSINYPSTDTDYHAYDGHTYSVTWQTEAGTVYGGTLNVTTGVLTVDKGYIDLSESIWTRRQAYTFSTSLEDNCNNAVPISEHFSDMFNVIYVAGYSGLNSDAIGIYHPSSPTGSTGTIYFRYSGIGEDSVSGLTAWFANNKPHLVYELATPQVVQLTPTQVRTVLGTNNIWNQMNSNNELAYRISNALN